MPPPVRNFVLALMAKGNSSLVAVEFLSAFTLALDSLVLLEPTFTAFGSLVLLEPTFTTLSSLVLLEPALTTFASLVPVGALPSLAELFTGREPTTGLLLT